MNTKKRWPPPNRSTIQGTKLTSRNTARGSSELTGFITSSQWRHTWEVILWAWPPHSPWSPGCRPPSWCRRASAAQCTRSWRTPAGRRTCPWTCARVSRPHWCSWRTPRGQRSSWMTTSSRTPRSWTSVRTGKEGERCCKERRCKERRCKEWRCKERLCKERRCKERRCKEILCKERRCKERRCKERRCKERRCKKTL